MRPIRGGLWRRAVVYSGVLALFAALPGTAAAQTGPQAAEAAPALTPPVGITADELPTWQTNGIVWALAEAGGTVFVGGTFSTVRPPGAAAGTQEEPVANFVALDAASGEPVADCDLRFTAGSVAAAVRSLAVSPDGATLYVGGTFGSVNGVGASNVAAFDTTTCERRSFPVAVPSTVRALAATDERVYLGGDFNTVAGQPRQRFAAVTTAGALEGWRADADEPGRAIEVTPDGDNVILGGDFFRLNGRDSHALAVVDAVTGATTRDYPLGFIEQRSVVKGLTVDDTGFYTANEGTGGGAFDGRIALELSTFDQRWRDTCLGATQDVTVHQGVLYSGHHAHDCSTMGSFPDGPRFHLFAQSVDDPTLLGWFPDTNDGLGEAIGPRVILTAEDLPQDDRDFIWVGGGFTTVNGSPQWGLTRFASGPDTGAPERPEVSAHSLAAGEATVTWRSSLDLDDSLLTYRVYRDSGTTPVHTVQGSSYPWQRPQLSFTDTGLTPGQSYSYRVTASDAAGNTSAQSLPATVTAAAGSQPYADAVLADDPVLYWRHDETGGFYASDVSGNDNSGVHRGNPSRGVTPAAVPYPGARGIGYTGGITTYTYSDTAFDSPGRFSVETWFRTESTQGGRIIGFSRNIWRTSTSYDKHVYMRDSGQLVFGTQGSGRQFVTSPRSYNDGRWHHLVATQGTNGLRLYVDGQLVASNANITSNLNYRGYWRTGADNLSGWNSRPSSDGFQGQLDETAVYHHTLTAARVTAHHNAASAPVDTVTTLQPTADTYVNQGAPSATHGSSTSLAVRGTSGYETYLRYALPQAPPGTVLKAAALRVRTTSQEYAGSEDSHTVVPVTGSWSEAATSWSTRPTLGTAVLGTIAAGTVPNGHYSAPLTVSAVRPSLGGTLDLAVTSTGTDNLWFWSREVAAVDNRPQLHLTFGAP
ncbi:LamG-like jellyroll fold domain-containing protein [Streptomyces lonarensis]|uniref:DNRLRE domain-containing protein n=1 Tax=Streptomyces lonarensis TaxID=700599 RepID=A0A7X6HXL6_9ACTN|nr:LamG-like jellyroll fold domain-containing protein [Streptomyces lonarensis]NJQ04691.1 DNRLRE domain-containing protein [Streptomyces lonarensis]